MLRPGSFPTTPRPPASFPQSAFSQVLHRRRLDAVHLVQVLQYRRRLEQLHPRVRVLQVRYLKPPRLLVQPLSIRPSPGTRHLRVLDLILAQPLPHQLAEGTGFVRPKRQGSFRGVRIFRGPPHAQSRQQAQPCRQRRPPPSRQASRYGPIPVGLEQVRNDVVGFEHPYARVGIDQERERGTVSVLALHPPTVLVPATRTRLEIHLQTQYGNGLSDLAAEGTRLEFVKDEGEGTGGGLEFGGGGTGFEEHVIADGKGGVFRVVAGDEGDFVSVGEGAAASPRKKRERRPQQIQE
mmetsp:Transcript_21226/g.42838  ORF Transcript_21226/g.42838 Transcript_21226/m.42838 type:complete len:294 (+) Transcript_21226:102-983(+)